MIETSPFFRSLLPWVWLLGALALLAAAIGNDLFGALSGAGVGDLVGVIVLALAFARLVHWRLKLGVARGVLLAFALLLFVRIGPAAVIATLALAAAAYALGDRLLGTDEGDAALRICIGLGLLLGVCGWLLPLPVHLRGLYVLGVAIVVGMHWGRLRLLARATLSPLRRPRLAPGAIGVFAWLAIGYAVLPAGLPTAMFDDLAYHLGLPSDLASLGYYRMDVQSQVWALAPWGSDVVHAIAQLLAGGEARGAVHLLWFGLALRLLWQLLAQHGLDARWRWLGLALFASQPLHYSLAQSMQTEMATQTLLLAVITVIGRVTPTTGARSLLGLGVLVGALLSMKVLTLVYLAPLALWFAWRWRSPAVHRLLPAALLMLAVGGSSYAYAWLVAGNPLLPLFNDLFASPYFPLVRFTDLRYHPGNPLLLPWQMIFAADTLHEGWKGSGGFQWYFVALALPWLIADARTRIYALLGSATVILLCTQIVHLRYALPALLAFAVALPLLLARHWPRGGQLLVLGLIALNLLFAQSSSWMLRHGTLVRYQLRPGGDRHFLAEFAPQRLLLASLKARGEPFMVIGDDSQNVHAELSGRGIVGSLYDYATMARMVEARERDTPELWQALFRDHGVSHALASVRNSDPRYLRALDRFGEIEDRSGDALLYRLPPWPLASTELTHAARIEHAIDVGGDEALEVAFTATARCHAVGEDAISARLFFDDRGWEGARALAWRRCDHTTAFPLHGRAKVKAGYDRARFEIAGPLAGEQAGFTIEDLRLYVRRDLTTERDGARRLLGRYR